MKRRSRYRCICVFCQGCFFKFKVQIRGIFRTQSSIYDEDFLRKWLTTFSRYLHKKAPSQMFNWFLNTPLQFSIFYHPSRTYATFLGSCSNLGYRMYLVSLVSLDGASRASPNHRFCQLNNTLTNNPSRLCYKTLNFIAQLRYIYFMSDHLRLLKTARTSLYIYAFYAEQC